MHLIKADYSYTKSIQVRKEIQTIQKMTSTMRCTVTIMGVGPCGHCFHVENVAKHLMGSVVSTPDAIEMGSVVTTPDSI